MARFLYLYDYQEAVGAGSFNDLIFALLGHQDLTDEAGRLTPTAPDPVPRGVVDEMNLCIERVHTLHAWPARLPIELLVRLLTLIKDLIAKAQARPHLHFPSNPRLRELLQFSQTELRKVPDSEFESVLSWWSCIMDAYSEKLQQCVPFSLPPLTWDTIVGYLVTGGVESIATLSEGSGPADSEVEGRLIAGCIVAGVHLYKLLYLLLYSRSRDGTNCATRLIHHIRIFDSALRSYAGFFESSPHRPLGVIQTERDAMFPLSGVQSFSFAGQSHAVYSKHYTLVGHCKKERVYHVEVLFHCDQTPSPHPQSIVIPEGQSFCQPPSVHPSEDFLACVLHGSGDSNLTIYRLDDLEQPVTVVSITELGEALGVTIDKIVNVHISFNHMVLHFSEKLAAPVVAVLQFSDFEFSLSTTISTLLDGSLVSALRTSHFIQDDHSVVLYRVFHSHQEIARVESDPEYPWNVRFDLSFAQRYLFYRGREIQIRASDLSIAKTITLDTAPSSNYHLSLHGDLVFGQNEHSLVFTDPQPSAVPYLEPFILTADNPTPLYLPQYPQLSVDTAIYCGRLTTEGGVEILQVLLRGKRPGKVGDFHPVLYQNVSFAVFSGETWRRVMVERVGEVLREQDEAMKRWIVARRADKERNGMKRHNRKKRKRQNSENEVQWVPSKCPKQAVDVDGRKMIALVNSRPERFYTGRITAWLKTYGFASTEFCEGLVGSGGRVHLIDVFVHRRSVGRVLSVGERIRFRLTWKEGMPKPRARDVQVTS